MADKYPGIHRGLFFYAIAKQHFLAISTNMSSQLINSCWGWGFGLPAKTLKTGLKNRNGSFILILALMTLPFLGYSQCSSANNWNSWGGSGNTSSAPGIIPTCWNQTFNPPSTGYTFMDCTGGNTYSFTATGGSGWTTPYVTVWQSTNSGGSWTYVGGGANSYSFTAGTAASIQSPASSGTGFYYLLVVYNGNSCTPSWPGTSCSLVYKETNTSVPSSPTPGTPGNGVWNIYSYNGNGNSAQSLPISNATYTNYDTYTGYYTYNAGAVPTYSTLTSWNTNGSPAWVTGYVGCNALVDLHVVQMVETNIANHMWEIDVADHDDDAELFINPGNYDSQDGAPNYPIWAHTASCCDIHSTLSGQNTTANASGTYYGIGEPLVLSASDIVDFRHWDGGGGSHQGLTFTDVTNSAPRTNISATASVTGCTSSGSATVALSGGLTGVKTIKITQLMNSCMNIAEVQALDLFNGTNWAASSNGGVATASSYYQSNAAYGPGMANDGNTGNLFHSNCNQNDWLQIALPASENLKSVVIYNRTDCCQSREAELKVEFFDASSNLLYCKIINASASGATTIPVITGSWSNGATTQTISGLSAGTYTYSYSDACGRSTTAAATITVPSLTDGTFGTNQWNVFGYNATNYTNYYGYYQMNTSTLSFDTRLGVANSNTWSWNQSTQGPSNASGYVGCQFGNTNISYRFMRRGFPCGYYTILYANDDGAYLKIDGNTITSPGCCTPGGSGAMTASFGSFFLGPNSTIEFGVTQGGGDTYGGLQFTSSGSLSITSASSVCYGGTIPLTASYTGQAGGTWAVTSGGSYASISGSTLTNTNSTGNIQYVGISYTSEGCTATQTIAVGSNPNGLTPPTTTNSATQTTTGTFGNNQWNIYVYNAGDVWGSKLNVQKKRGTKKSPKSPFSLCLRHIYKPYLYPYQTAL